MEKPLVSGPPMSKQEYDVARYDLIKLLAIQELVSSLWPSARKSIIRDYTGQCLLEEAKKENQDLKGITPYWEQKIVKKVNKKIEAMDSKIRYLIVSSNNTSIALKDIFDENSQSKSLASVLQKVILQAIEVASDMLSKDLTLATISYEPLKTSKLEIGTTVLCFIPGDPNSPFPQPAIVSDKGLKVIKSTGSLFIPSSLDGVLVAKLDSPLSEAVSSVNDLTIEDTL